MEELLFGRGMSAVYLFCVIWRPFRLCMRTFVIIPALNEATAIGQVIRYIPRQQVEGIIVVDNGSTDDTAAVARAAGALVLSEPRRGYGQACLLGTATALAQGAEVLVFLDGDFSDDPGELPLLLEQIRAGADMVIGSRVAKALPGALMPQQRFGNWLATRLIGWLYGYSFSDLGPFRAIRSEAFRRLRMADTSYGWTVEMQVKAARLGLVCTEVPVSYRPRIGQSKISGTVKGTFLAGYKILWTTFKFWRFAG